MREEGRLGCIRGLAGIVATVGGLIAGIVVVMLAFLALVLPLGLDGCDVSLDFGPENLGVSGEAGGAITVRVPTCHSGNAQAMQLVAPDGTVLWRAEAATQQNVRDFLIGLPPTGFVNTVPLTVTLDPEITYEVQLLLIPTTTGTSTPITDPSVLLIGGARTTFAPVDLRPDMVLFGTQQVTPDVFDAVACEPPGN